MDEIDAPRKGQPGHLKEGASHATPQKKPGEFKSDPTCLEGALKVDGQDDPDADDHDDEGEGDEVTLKLEVLDGVAATLLQKLLVTTYKKRGIVCD